ncbi:MAG: hypothetical protein ACM3MF_00705 [Anaerolineae bacterium]
MRLFRTLASHRTYLGVLLGIATWLLFDLLFGGPGSYTHAIAVFIAIWVSGTYEPKRLAGLGLLVGFPAGIFETVRILLRMDASMTLTGTSEQILATNVVAAVGAAYITFVFAFDGFLFGSIAQLCRRKAIL